MEKTAFGSLPDGREIISYTLSNNRGMEVDIVNYGAIITAIRVPDRTHEPGDVVLGFDNLEAYLGEHPYMGAVAGRVCNRIGGARFEVDGKMYRLNPNEGRNQLHGGVEGFDKKVWTAFSVKTLDQVSLKLGYESPDGEEGYPGTLMVEVEYSLNDNNELGIVFRAKTDKPGHVNLTNHSYFNLNNCEGSILEHELFIDADRCTELDEASIPTGSFLGVEGTPYDFRVSKAIGEDIGRIAPGYDINYVLSMEARELTRVAAVHDPASGRTMEVLTSLPGLQLYTANYVDGIVGKGGKVYHKHSALCLETQFFPDSCNHEHFPSTLLRPGEEFHEMTVYRFSAR
ncbi:MAG: galactose-1-epimerase [Bacteroidetes bacterium]|nr:MAG: galactose-1-epimerase [Bacteroidota bacterium]